MKLTKMQSFMSFEIFAISKYLPACATFKLVTPNALIKGSHLLCTYIRHWCSFKKLTAVVCFVTGQAISGYEDFPACLAFVYLSVNRGCNKYISHRIYFKFTLVKWEINTTKKNNKKVATHPSASACGIWCHLNLTISRILCTRLVLNYHLQALTWLITYCVLYAIYSLIINFIQRFLSCHYSYLILLEYRFSIWCMTLLVCLGLFSSAWMMMKPSEWKYLTGMGLFVKIQIKQSCILLPAFFTLVHYLFIGS